MIDIGTSPHVTFPKGSLMVMMGVSYDEFQTALEEYRKHVHTDNPIAIMNAIKDAISTDGSCVEIVHLQYDAERCLYCGNRVLDECKNLPCQYCGAPR